MSSGARVETVATRCRRLIATRPPNGISRWRAMVRHVPPGKADARRTRRATASPQPSFRMTGCHVIIIGAGIGGLAAALSLHRHGMRVSVYEQAPELREFGAGLMVTPNAMHALDFLGVGDVIAATSNVSARAADQTLSYRGSPRASIPRRCLQVEIRRRQFPGSSGGRLPSGLPRIGDNVHHGVFAQKVMQKHTARPNVEATRRRPHFGRQDRRRYKRAK